MSIFVFCDPPVNHSTFLYYIHETYNTSHFTIFKKKIIVIITGEKGQKTGFVLLLIKMWVTQILETPINTMSNSLHEKIRYVSDIYYIT